MGSCNHGVTEMHRLEVPGLPNYTDVSFHSPCYSRIVVVDGHDGHGVLQNAGQLGSFEGYPIGDWWTTQVTIFVSVLIEFG